MSFLSGMIRYHSNPYLFVRGKQSSRPGRQLLPYVCSSPIILYTNNPSRNPRKTSKSPLPHIFKWFIIAAFLAQRKQFLFNHLFK